MMSVNHGINLSLNTDLYAVHSQKGIIKLAAVTSNTSQLTEQPSYVSIGSFLKG